MEARKQELDKEEQSLKDWEKRLQEGRDRIHEGERLLNKREQSINQRDEEVKRLEKKQLDIKSDLERDRLLLQIMEGDLNSRLAIITEREEVRFTT